MTVWVRELGLIVPRGVGVTAINTPGSLRKDDGNGNDDARKQWSDWFNEEKYSCCTCGTHFTTILWRSLPNDNVKFRNLRFYRQREHSTVNLSFSLLTSTALLPVHLRRALSTMGSLRIDDFGSTTPLDFVTCLLRIPVRELTDVAPKSTMLVTAICRRLKQQDVRLGFDVFSW